MLISQTRRSYSIVLTTYYYPSCLQHIAVIIYSIIYCIQCMSCTVTYRVIIELFIHKMAAPSFPCLCSSMVLVLFNMTVTICKYLCFYIQGTSQSSCAALWCDLKSQSHCKTMKAEMALASIDSTVICDRAK